MTELRLRPAADGDRDFVRRLSASVFARFGDYDATLPETMGLSWVRTIVAETGGRAVAFAMYSLEALAVREIELLAIAVEPEWQSRGIGRRLLEHVEGAAPTLVRGRGTAWVHLNVAEDNEAARRLFESSGYLPTGTEHGHYAGGQRSIGMRKRLAG